MKSRHWVADERRQSLWCVCEVIAADFNILLTVHLNIFIS